MAKIGNEINTALNSGDMIGRSLQQCRSSRCQHKHNHLVEKTCAVIRHEMFREICVDII